jgi:hypothetical protein
MTPAHRLSRRLALLQGALGIGAGKAAFTAASAAAQPAPDSTAAFRNGFPTETTARQSHDDQDHQRPVQAYRFFYPTVSMEATFQGTRDAGVEDNKAVMLMACGPRHIMFTGNSDTPYSGGVINLRTFGPAVIELPPGPFLGIINDHNFGWLADVGLPGPDMGRGGKHLVLPPDHEGPVPDGYFASRSKTYFILLGVRALPQEGNMQAALDLQRQIKIYPLSQAQNPPPYGWTPRTTCRCAVRRAGSSPLAVTCPCWHGRVTGFGRRVPLFVGAVGLCGRNSGAEPGQAAEVVDEIGDADLRLRSRYADGTHEQRHAVLLRGKDMLDAGADAGA